MKYLVSDSVSLVCKWKATIISLFLSLSKSYHMTIQVYNFTFKVSLLAKAHGLDLVQIISKNSIKSHLSECKRNAHLTFNYDVISHQII